MMHVNHKTSTNIRSLLILSFLQVILFVKKAKGTQKHVIKKVELVISVQIGSYEH